LEWVAVGPNKGGLVERFWRLVEVQTAANLTNLASRFPDGVSGHATQARIHGTEQVEQI
jgi:hypothetical protein